MHNKLNLSKKIITWYDNNRRSLPWRVPFRSPKKLYYRLLSEFMLQQTQVKTVIPYFNKFRKKINNLDQLSTTNEKKILKLWEGLGYYRRAKNLLLTSKILVKTHKGKLPNNIEEIRKLPGVGEYTSNILLALVHNKPAIAIDGNVKRVFHRLYFGGKKNINIIDFLKKNKEKFYAEKRNSDFAEALMEFGALICSAKNPKCSICKLKNFCKFYKNGKNSISLTSRVVREKKFNVYCYLDRKDKRMALTNRNKLGFLKNFYLPSVEQAAKKSKNWNYLCSYKNTISNIKMNIKLYYKFSSKIPKNFCWYSISQNKEFIPKFTKKVFNKVLDLY